MKRIVTFFVLSVFFLLLSCNDSTNTQNSNPLLFAEYMSGFTSGMASVETPIEVIVKPDIPKGTKLENVFTITPKVEGAFKQKGNRKIQFVPKEQLQSDTEYKVCFHLSKVLKVNKKELKNFYFSFKTKKQSVSVTPLDLQSYNENTYFLNGNIEANDYLSSATAQKMLAARFNGKELKIKIQGTQKRATQFHFIVDSISALNSKKPLEILWNGTPFGIDSKGRTEVTIPSKNHFTVMEVKSNDSNNKMLWINFSKPLQKNQNFKGLVAINNKTNLKFSVSGNVLKVYSDKPFEGDAKVEVFRGIKSDKHKKIKKGYAVTLTFEQQKPQVRFVKNGTILPSSNNLKINFEAVGLRAVKVKIFKIYQNNILQFLQDNDLGYTGSITKVGAPIAKKVILLKGGQQSLKKWSTYGVDVSSLILPEPGAIYRAEITYTKKYALFNCAGGEEVTDAEILADDEDESKYTNYYNYNWEERNDPCKVSYYYNKELITNVLASDLGVIAKKGENNHYFIATTNLISAKPEGNVEVQLFDYQQQLVHQGTTDSEGVLQVSIDKEAYFVVAKKDKNTTYLKIDDGRSQSLSNFNVDGTKLQKGINGYIYTERGVWRPGDSIYVSFVLNDKVSKLPENHPIKFLLLNPNGKVVLQQVQNSNNQNLYKFVAKTSPTAITGNWQVTVKVGAAIFQKNIKIETIKPNRYKIKNSLAQQFISNTGERGAIGVHWLHGAIAKNAQVDVKAKLYPKKTAFKGFEKYNFNNIAHQFSSDEMGVYKGKTNAEGEVFFNFKPKNIGDAPGMLQVRFLTKATESGGDFSTDVATASYSPFTSYVGLKMPELNKYGYIETEKNHSFKVVSVSEKGSPKAYRNLKVQVYKTRWSWWWDASNKNISNFSASDQKTAYYSKYIKTDANGKATFKLNVKDADWGRYVFIVTDVNSGHSTSDVITIDWDYWSGKSRKNNNSEATLLALSTNKKEYNTNEKVKISFPSDENARALVSIENGTKVLKTYWVEGKKGETTFEFPLEKEMAPNVYIYVTLIQPHQKTENDAPIRLYGIAPIGVANKETHLNPEIKMADVLRPKEKTTIKVSEKDGREMDYTLAIVEDGLLDLTRFKTPNPWTHFFSKTALGVKTWDMFNDVIGAYGGTINQIFSIGGDEDLGAGKAKKANRFKPLVIFKGPFHLKRGKTDKHEIQIPNYIGSARVMVVASNVKDNAYGKADKTTPVRSPLMILGSLPRKVSPSEKITLPVTVFAMEKNIKNVNVSVKTDDNIWLTGEATQKLHFKEVGEQMAYFNLNVGNLLGVSKITIEATSGNKKALYEVEMDVFNPNPRTYKYQDASLQKGEGTTLNWDAFGVTGSNQAVLEISGFPGINLDKRLNYLLAYPHGCGEQITSKGFPQVYLPELMTLTPKQLEDTQKNVNAAIQKLAEQQLSNGGFSYWKGGAYANDWVTSYIGHFYIEAEKKGYALPIGSKQKWINYQKRMARNWRYEKRYQNDFPQAYRLYTLALAGEPEIAAMNRMREISTISNEGKLRLAATYALVGQKKVANALFSESTLGNSNSRYYYYGSETRNKAMALETAMGVQRKTVATELALEIAKKLSSEEWMSTQTTAFALCSVAQYIQANKSGKDIEVEYTCNGISEKLSSKNAFISKKLKATASNNQISVKNNSSQTVYIRILNSGILPIGEEIAQENGLSVVSQFKNRNNVAIDVNNLPQGTEFLNTITVTNLSQKNIENIALTQLIPSGWEIINMRYADYNTSKNNADYSDFRDDRVNYYFGLGAKKSKTFTITINASYLGKYYLPGAYAEAMYNHRYSTRTQGKWVEVVK